MAGRLAKPCRGARQASGFKITITCSKNLGNGEPLFSNRFSWGAVQALV